MRRIAALLAALAALSLALAVPALAAAGDGSVKTFNRGATLGYYRDQIVSYYDLGPVKLAGGNRVAPIWVFPSNGAAGQRNIIDTVPGQKGYTPLWAVRLVTWKDGVSARVLRSAAAVKKAVASGEATVKATPIVVNCPVL
ncbi:hypothetical protein Gocc_1623 [Gaiella occulta]|uniref:DUF7482 domain-containing protein n=1 Tax=Gaiella occulta TaxID=1002870 RepID=A0A7M2YXZ0_9ACTN|nr:hypothetical protein [Gaiella occulta]RDI74734.1 hypothetical protein Gocc_1623 [Gaiella occulta]